MSTSLEAHAEIVKLARVLRRDPATLAYLDRIPAQDIRGLREQVTEMLFTVHGSALGRMAAAGRVLPTGLMATISQRAFGPLLSARIAGMVEPRRAVEVASKLPPEFLADIAVELDPRRASDVIARVPPRLVAEITRELVARREYVTMGRFVAHLSDAALGAALGELDDEGLLRVAFVLENKDQLDHVVSLLDPARLDAIVAAGTDDELWPEALEVLRHLSPDLLRRLIEPVSELDPAQRAQLTERARKAGVLDELGPLRDAFV